MSAYPPALAAQAAAINAVLGRLRTHGPVQETLTLGTRWDVAPNLALKGQYDRVDVDEGSNGTFRNIEAGYLPDGSHVFSLSLDFLF